MPRYLTFWLVALLFAGAELSAQSHIGFVTPKHYRAKRIPIQVVNNLVIIPVELNNGIKMNFLLDSGVKTSILFDHELAVLFEESTKRPVQVQGLGPDEPINATLVFNVTLKVGECSGDYINMIILPENSFNLTEHLGMPVHGVIGFELFERFAVEIDYVQQYVKLHPPGKFRAGRPYQKLEIEIVNEKPVIETECVMENADTLRLRLLADTGASIGMTIDQFSDERISVPKHNLPNVYLGTGLSGELFGDIARVEHLQLKKFELHSVVAAFPDRKSIPHLLESASNKHGLIGGEIWRRFRVIFDYQNKLLYLKKNRRFRQAFEYNKSGMLVKARGPNLQTFVIASIDEDSPAEQAGLEVNDIIIGMSGYHYESMNLAQIHGLLNETPGGRKLSITILRGKEQKKVSLLLRSAI